MLQWLFPPLPSELYQLSGAADVERLVVGRSQDEVVRGAVVGIVRIIVLLQTSPWITVSSESLLLGQWRCALY